MNETVKERPILFSAPMVRAILEGRKTQTRRVVKPQPIDGNTKYPGVYPAREYMGPKMTGKWGAYLGESGADFHVSPYGKPGDRLWVRETWQAVQSWQEYGVWFRDEIDADGAAIEDVCYRADDPKPDEIGWRPSIFMPRRFSRITLEVTGVRVERLGEITEEDAIAEGSQPILEPPDGGSAPHAEGFRQLWNSIHGPGAWQSNPWVWVIEFKRATP